MNDENVQAEVDQSPAAAEAGTVDNGQIASAVETVDNTEIDVIDGELPPETAAGETVAPEVA